MDFTGSFSISISDTKLDFKDIEENLKLVPTKIIKRGQFLGIYKHKEAPYDIWAYEEKITHREDPQVHLTNLLNALLPYKVYIEKIGKIYDRVVINCYIRSDFGQIGFVFNNEVIRKLNELEINVEFHILSFGGVED